MKPFVRLAACLGAASFAAAVAAQPIYRCGNTYSRVGCPGARSVQTLDGPSAGDRARAARALAAEQRQVVTLAADRERREAAPRPGPANIGPAPAPSASAVANLKPPKRAKGKVRVVKPEDFTARAPRAAKPPKVKGPPPAP